MTQQSTGSGLPIARHVVVFAAYTLTALPGLLFAFPGTSASGVWPPAGIGLGAALLLGPRIWPAIALGALSVNLAMLTSLGFAPQAVLGAAMLTAAGNTLEAIVGAWLVRGATRGRDPLSKPADVARFIFLGAILATTISATTGLLALSLVGAVTGHGARIWSTWWLGDAIGVVVIAPLLLTWKDRPRELPGRRAAEMLALLATIVGFVWVSRYLGALGRFYFTPLLLWAGARFGRFESAVVALLFAGGYTLAILLGGRPETIGVTDIGFLNHEAYVGIVVACLLLLASLVHQLKLSHDAVEASERRFRNLFEMHHSIMILNDPARGVVLDANPAATTFYGYSREALRGMPIRELSALPPEAVQRNLDRTLRGELSDFVTTHRLASGEERRVELRTSPVGPGDQPTFLAIITDVTERERIERTHELLGAIVSSSDDAILSKDLEGRVLSWNPGAERMYGYSAADMIGQPISAIVPADRLEEHERNMARVRAGTEVHRLETERVRKDGRRLAVSLTISPLRDAKGEVFGSSTVARDVTERNALAERLLHSQKLESLGTMAGGVAHDFNNILTTIIGYTDLMKLDMCEECPVRPSLAPIEHASAQAKSLTGSLLAFSRKQVMSPAAIRVNDLVEAFTGILGRLIGEHIELVLDLCPSNPAVLVESSQIGQVLMNLAMNARDAMPTGGTLTIATRPCQPVRAGAAGREDDSASGVRITVSDTGTGIDGALRDRIFEPFFTTKSRGRGTGLGLSLAYGIVEQHGGSLRLEPGDAPGATFSISLPVVADPEFPEAEPGSGPMPRGRECVLLVEDNADVRGLGRSVLERHGYCVLEARDGQHAIEILAERARDIDLVLSDVVMPRRSGREVFDTAARLRPELPVILTSGYLDEAIPMEWIQREGRDFLPKPTTPSQLLCKVRTVLDRGR